MTGDSDGTDGDRSLPVVDREAVRAALAAGSDSGTGAASAAGDDRPETATRTGDGPTSRPAVAGVLLAAGRSERFGAANKLLADLDGEPLVRHAAVTLTAAPLDRVVAVVGHEADRVRTALSDLPLSVVDNPDHAEGQSTSVRAGVQAVRGADALVFALGDMPRVDPETVALLVDAYRAGLGDPLAAAHEGRRGNPVLFGARHFEALADVAGDTGGRRLLTTHEDAALVGTGDPGVRQDVDTPAALERLRER
jgi:molybdenum cofactor cytidylyltransferase